MATVQGPARRVLDAVQQPTRRRLLALTGAATAGGIGLLATTKTARAEVSIRELTIPDKNAGVTSDVTNVILATTFNYSFQSTAPLDSCVFQLRIGTTQDDLQPITGVRKTGIGESGSGTERLQGSVLDHPGFDASMFDPETGGTVSQSIVVELRMLLKKNGSVEHSASAQAQPTITVNDETVSVESTLDGSGGATVVE